MSLFQKSVDTSLTETPHSEGTVDLGTREQSIPLIEEQLEIGKRTVTTGTVRLHKHTEERIETVNLPRTSVSYSVERTPVGRVVAEPPPMRQEGETTIYPVLEERVVITRELVLREEIHVTRITTTTEEQTNVTLLREEITADRD